MFENAPAMAFPKAPAAEIPSLERGWWRRIVEEVLASDTRTVACVVSQDRMAEARSLREADQGAGRLHLFAGSAALPAVPA